MIQVSQLTKGMHVRRQSGHFLKDLFQRQNEIKTILDNVTFNIGEGEKVALIGRNGSGKSTLLKHLTGIVPLTSGTIRIAGLDPHRDRRRLMWQVGVLFAQKSYLYPNLTLNDCIGLYCAARKVSVAERNQNLEMLNTYLQVYDFADHQVRTLSFGQRMRSELVCAMIHNPNILFLDEPTVGLDVVSRDLLRAFLTNVDVMAQRTVLLVSHDAEIVSQFSDRCIELSQGSVIYDGPSDTFLQNQRVVYDLLVDPKRPLPEPLKEEKRVRIKENRDGQLLLTFKQGTTELAIQKFLEQVMISTSVLSLHRKTIPGTMQDNSKRAGDAG